MKPYSPPTLTEIDAGAMFTHFMAMIATAIGDEKSSSLSSEIKNWTPPAKKIVQSAKRTAKHV